MRYVTRLAALALAATISLPALAEEPIVFRVSADTPSAGSAWTAIMMPWMDRIEQRSNGRIKFERYPDGVVSKMGQTVAATANGVVDIGWDLPAVYGSRFNSLQVTTMPGITNDPAKTGEAVYRAYQEGVVGQEFEANYKLLFVQITQNVIFFSKGALGHTQFGGTKIGVGNKARATMVQNMGGVPIVVPPPGYYESMQHGNTSSIMTSIGALTATRTDELVDHALFGPFGGGMLMVGMNREKYDALPADLKTIFDEESGVNESRISSQAQFDTEQDQLKGMVSKGMVVEKLTDEEIAAWQPQFDLVIKDWLSATPNGDAVLKRVRELIAE